MATDDIDLVLKLSKMPLNEAINYLDDNHIPNEWRASLLSKATELRLLNAKVVRQVSLTYAHHMELWYRLIAPLKYELSNAKVGRKLKDISTAPDRYVAFDEYVKLLEKLLAGLQKMQIEELNKLSHKKYEAVILQRDQGKNVKVDKPRTPGDLAEERGLPNNGLHWTDWINERTKNRIVSLFDAIDTKAKRPKPFARRISPYDFTRQLPKLQKRTLSEITVTRQELEMLEAIEKPTLEQEARIVKLQDDLTGMQLALGQTLYMHNEPVPYTWHGVYVSPEDWNKRMDQAAEVEAALRLRFEPTEEQIREAKHNKKKSRRPKRYFK